MDYLVGEIRAIEPLLSAIPTMGLPIQLIHGDLHFDNVMVVGDTVSGCDGLLHCTVQLCLVHVVMHIADAALQGPKPCPARCGSRCIIIAPREDLTRSRMYAAHTHATTRRFMHSSSADCPLNTLSCTICYRLLALYCKI